MQRKQVLRMGEDSMIHWPDTLFVDTRRSRGFDYIVHATTSVSIEGHDVELDVIGVGEGREGTEKAFTNMEEVLDSMGFYGEIVRVY